MGGFAYVCLNRIGAGKSPGISRRECPYLGEFGPTRRNRAHTHLPNFLRETPGLNLQNDDEFGTGAVGKACLEYSRSGLGVASAAGIDTVLQGQIAAAQK